MIHYVLTTLAEAGIGTPVVVIGRGAEELRAQLGPNVRLAEQKEQLGTAHAVMQALPLLPEDGAPVMILYGDTPFLRPSTLQALFEQHQQTRATVTLLSAIVDDPTGYGRILRDKAGTVVRVVEQTDCTPEEAQIREINAGAYVFDLPPLREALPALRPTNVQGEYYLPDTIAWFLQQGRRVRALVADAHEILGINSRRDLAVAEAAMREKILFQLMDAGVTIIDPSSTYIHATVTVGQDTVIHPHSFLEGHTTIGGGCVIGPQARLLDATLADRVTVVASTVTESTVGEGTRIGPYSHLRPGTRLGRSVEIGNYAELKNSTIGDYTKVHHVSYLGDATVGTHVNIGAGTITCNYRHDIRGKNPTVIEDGAFIGSDSMLIAPVRIGRGAVTGAGAVVNKDVPAGAVAVGVPARVIRHVAADTPH
jgi:bifunctional UDP-N-acetylglucosamine pyrophosphorylase/glucosamine-1-phosphate N-acetyltransferase